jgi:hypothetical protein
VKIIHFLGKMLEFIDINTVEFYACNAPRHILGLFTYFIPRFLCSLVLGVNSKSCEANLILVCTGQIRTTISFRA